MEGQASATIGLRVYAPWSSRTGVVVEVLDQYQPPWVRVRWDGTDSHNFCPFDRLMVRPAEGWWFELQEGE